MSGPVHDADDESVPSAEPVETVETVETPGETRADGRRHRSLVGRLVLVGAAVGVLGLIVLGYGFLALRLNWFPFHSATPEEVTLDEARRRFLEDAGNGESGSLPFIPTPGVYEYQGSGTETLSNPPRSQPEGPLVPGTVTLGEDGCWTQRLDYSTNHYREWNYCATDTQLTQTGTRVSQRWDFGSFGIENLSTIECRPPGVVMTAGMAIGDEWTSKCRGDNTQISGTTVSAGTHRLVGVEQLDVGGTQVEAFHFRDERKVSDAQSGTEDFEVWLDRSGLLLKVTQRIEIVSSSPLGNVTYTQNSEFSLVSTTPKR